MFRSLAFVLTWCLLFVAVAPAASAESVVWEFDHQREIIGTANLLPGQIAHGHLSGQAAWDPYVSLRVPTEGIDAQRFTWLTVRLYSSDKADVLDVYYESPDGRWCLGGKFPIAKGWATYRMDLTKNSGAKRPPATSRGSGAGRAGACVRCASIRVTRPIAGWRSTTCVWRHPDPISRKASPSSRRARLGWPRCACRPRSKPARRSKRRRNSTSRRRRA